MTKVQERFLKYVAVDTQSAEGAACYPSTEKQKNLAKLLVEEMKSIGIDDAVTNDYGYVYGTIPSNTDRQGVPAIGFIAHMDTSPDMPGDNIKARIIENYDGKDIVLNKEKNIVMRVAEFDHLVNYIGQDLIVTDGTTLLGSDDKAGIAEIMAMAEYFTSHPEVKHGTIKLGFTPDEEVGGGTDHFDIKGFGADFAYTVDGGALGEVEYENFNAANAHVTVTGINIHPGSAKNKMKNSLLIGIEFQNMVPVFENPANTENYEGFYHLCDMEGSVEKTTLTYIIRDHDMEKFTAKKERLRKIEAYLNDKYGEGTVTVEIKDSYLNMKEHILPHMHIIETARKAMAKVQVESITNPIRGGTDGARLSYDGLPCPNLCTGGHSCHSRYEYVPIQSMEKIVEILKNIVTIYAEN